MAAEEIQHCRVCGREGLNPIFSLGDLYVSDFIDVNTSSSAKTYPLDLVLCSAESGGCGLLQLAHTVPPDEMYRNYWYRSGINRTMTEELAGIARAAEGILPLSPGDIVVDIGANDGTLLRSYSHPEIMRVGFEPARNLIPYTREGTSKVFNDLFSYTPFAREFGGAKAKVITSIAMFYDIDDPNAFVSDVRSMLDPNGLFVIQMSYLPAMLSQNAFDNVCHEHVEFYSLFSLENLLTRHGLKVFDVELNDVNGGSFRTYIRHAGSAIGNERESTKRVNDLRTCEKTLGLQHHKIYDEFASRVTALREELTGFIREETEKGKKVYVYGASTKGNTLLQYYGLDASLITAAAERNPMKWGKKTIGTNIPIISEEQARAEKPDYFLVLPWHFLPEFLERETSFREQGGKFIVPLPEFRII